MYSECQRNSHLPGTLNWPLIFIGIFIFVTCAYSVPQYQSFNAYRKPDQQQFSNIQGQDRYGKNQGQGFNTKNNNGNFKDNGNGYGQQQYHGSGQEQNSPNQFNKHLGPRRRPYNESLNPNSYKCRITVPIVTLDKYPYATKFSKVGEILQIIETCCAGFEAVRLRGLTYCIPACSNCANGICVAPEECECHEEFVKNDNDDCVFTCPIGCLNGKCYLDGTCECDPGYKLDETRKFCRPICSAGCGETEKHNCTEPEVCGCSKGYRLTYNYQGDFSKCEPTCDPDCGTYGTCVGPNECLCDNGRTEKNGICPSNCYQNCANGLCVGPNRCICNPGFTYHESSTQCVPV